MATYNGELYVEEQVISILKQLSDGDELIVSDDGSSDQTISILSKITDSRIKIFKNTNIGHVRNFQRVIEYADGDIILLSDQDDIWHSDKIKKVMDVFRLFPDVSFIQHSFIKINDEGIVLETKKNANKTGRLAKLSFFIKQLIKPDFYGCATAFRNSAKEALIPFPKFVYAHDHWMLITAIFCGQIYYLDDALIFYRQHGSNLTPRKGLNLYMKIYHRCLFILMMLVSIKRYLISYLCKSVKTMGDIN